VSSKRHRTFFISFDMFFTESEHDLKNLSEQCLSIDTVYDNLFNAHHMSILGMRLM